MVRVTLMPSKWRWRCMHPLLRILPSKSVDCNIFRQRCSSTCRAGPPIEELSKVVESGSNSRSTRCWANAAKCCTARDRPPSCRRSNSSTLGVPLVDVDEEDSKLLIAERQRRMWPCHCGVLRCLKDPSANVKMQAPRSLLRNRKRASLKKARNCLRSECKNCWKSLFRCSPSLPRYFACYM